MTTIIRRFMPALTTTAGALLAIAFLSSAFAHADPNTFVVIPDPQDGPSAITAVGGIAPFDTTISYSGEFGVSFGGSAGLEGVFGNATYYSDTPPGCTTSNFRVSSTACQREVIDDLSFGNGYDNVYTDMIGAGPDGSNSITDIFVTPFGDFNIPTTYDAAADFPTLLGAAALDTDFTSLAAALDADWTTLVADFSALF